MLPSSSVTILEYLSPDGRSPYAEWFDDLNPPAAAKVAIALARLSQGNFSNVKAWALAFMNIESTFGPGYRIYFGKDGERIVLLLGGGTKKRQKRDIAAAMERWHLYKRMKKRETQ